MRVVAIVIVALLALPTLVSADSYAPKSSYIAGPGLSGLHIEGTPDDHGLVWQIREPERTFDSWTVIVVNSTNQPISNVRATLEIQVDGQWYLANMDASKRLMTPPTILPGEFAFAKMGDIGGAPPAWTASRIVIDSIGEERDTTVVSLAIEDGKVGANSFEGRFTNRSNYTVNKLTLYVGCVVDGELANAFVFVSDLLKLDPDHSEAFEFGSRFDSCDTADDVIVTAIAAVR